MSEYAGPKLRAVVKDTKTTLNDLPIPGGSWLGDFQTQARKWNVMLVAGAAACGVTMWVVSMPPESETFERNGNHVTM